MEGVSRPRLDTIPFAAVVMEGLIERLNLGRIAISAYGVREGLLYEAMTRQTRALDPLIAGCATLLGARSGLSDDLGPALEAWVTPMFAALPPMFAERDPTLIAAVCRLADLGARLHPDHRADLVFEQVLRAPIAGLSHAERVFIASAAFSRHSASAAMPERQIIARLLSPERLGRAKALGAALRLGCDLSGRSPQLLGQSALSIKGDEVRLTAAPGWSDMLLGEQTAKRAGVLANQLGLKLRMGGEDARKRPG